MSKYSTTKQKQRKLYERIKDTEAQIDKNLQKITIRLNDIAFTKHIFTIHVAENVQISPEEGGGGPVG